MESYHQPPAGFESHWDAAYFRKKAEECRRLATISADPDLNAALMDLVHDFLQQGEEAERLAVIAFSRAS